jgi:hypothetical protein
MRICSSPAFAGLTDADTAAPLAAETLPAAPAAAAASVALLHSLV